MNYSQFDKYNSTFAKLGVENEVKLSINDVIDIHNEMINRYGGLSGIRDENLLKSVCNGVYQTYDGIELYDSVIKKASKLLFDFCTYQIFLDGNKRTGLGVCLALLEENKLALTLTPTKLYDFVINIANNNCTLKEVIDTIENNIKIFENKEETKNEEKFEERCENRIETKSYLEEYER